MPLLQPLIINLHIFPSGLPMKDSLSLFHSFHLLLLSDQLSDHIIYFRFQLVNKLISSPLAFLINSHIIYSLIAVSKRTHFISSHFSDQLFRFLSVNEGQILMCYHLQVFLMRDQAPVLLLLYPIVAPVVHSLLVFSLSPSWLIYSLQTNEVDFL